MKQTFKEFLRPKNGYTEGPMSLFTHNGILYKLDTMFELSVDLPVTMIKLDDMRWQVENLQADEARVKSVDIKVPIIVTPQNGQYIILDGTHRVLKALKKKEQLIPARVVFHDVLAMCRLGSGSEVAWASNVDDLNPYLGEGKNQRFTSFDEWAENYPEKIGSAFDAWMSENDLKKMWDKYSKGSDFKSKVFNFSGNKDSFWSKVDKWLDAEKSKGWIEFDRDENTDATEFILIKK